MSGFAYPYDFCCEGFVPVGAVGGLEGSCVRIRTTSGSMDLIRAHIARLEERALQAEANLRHVDAERRLSEKRADAAEHAAHEANEALRSLRADQFACETLVPLGDVDGSGNVWIRLRSTEDGVGMLLKQLCRLDERAVLAEAALASANERCRHFEKRAERADWIADELRSAKFEWADSIPVDEPGGERVLVRVRGTEGGIGKIKAAISRKEHHVSMLHESWLAADARADAAVLRVRNLQGTVKTYARFARAMRHLDGVTEAA